MRTKSDAALCLSAQRALWGAVGPNLISFSGEVRDKKIFLQFVVLDEIPDDEIDDYQCVGTEILADYIDEDIDEKFIKVATEPQAREVPHLAELFFLRKLDGVFA